MSFHRNTTVVCAYSIEDIDQAFSTSKLKGYNSPLSTPRPGTVQHTETLTSQRQNYVQQTVMLLYIQNDYILNIY